MDNVAFKTVTALNPTQALRQEAETLVSGKVIMSKENLAAMPPVLVLKMLHELQVHQIELEMQNEELRKSQIQLEVMRARYFDLYDLAPISYYTVSADGLILEANLAAAELLGEVRCKLVGKRISRYIRKECQDAYYLSRKLLSETGKRQDCELHMVKADGTSFWVNASIVSTIGSGDGKVQRMVLTDITVAKILSLALHESEQHLRILHQESVAATTARITTV
jgi:PAS domain S-box-containing protein